MRRVILESPYAGDIEGNVAYARIAVRDSLLRGEAPIASHLLYTQPGILKDEVDKERRLGIDAVIAWRAVAEASVVYTDLGISIGMTYGIRAARAAGIPVEFRRIAANAIGNGWSADLQERARQIAEQEAMVRSVAEASESIWEGAEPIPCIVCAAPTTTGALCGPCAEDVKTLVF